MKIGEKIRKLRELKGLSQENMGKMLGMNQQLYSKLESGKLPVSEDLLKTVAECLKMDMMRIIEFDDAPIFNNNHQQGGNNYQQNGEINNHIHHAYTKLELLEKLNHALAESVKLMEEKLILARELESYRKK